MSARADNRRKNRHERGAKPSAEGCDARGNVQASAVALALPSPATAAALADRGLRHHSAAGLAILALCGVICYANSFQAPPTFDGKLIFASMPTWRQIASQPGMLVTMTRPVFVLSLAFDRALFGDRVWGLHVTNLAIHIAAAWVLMLLVRQTLARSPRAARYKRLAGELSLVAALLWLVHPLQTQSVTYLWQRSESLMGLFYLISLYCLLQANTARRAGAWCAASIGCFLVALGTKEIAATAPFVALWYDRVFLASSWREVFRRRWGYYMVMFGALALAVGLAVILLRAQYAAGGALAAEGVTWIGYARTQPEILLHYLRLVVWPQGQCVDYGWRIAQQPSHYVPQCFLLAGLIALVAWSTWRYPALGFLAGSALLILAPTSSVIPIGDLAFEHRMYLPLAPLILLAVVAVAEAARKAARAQDRRAGKELGGQETEIALWPRGLVRALALIAVAGVAMLSAVTIARNQAYASEIAFWADIVAKRPQNARARANLGYALADAKQYPEAAEQFREAIRRLPPRDDLYYALGLALWRSGRDDEAIAALERAAELAPQDHNPQDALGAIYLRKRDPAAALAHYRRAVALAPRDAATHYNLGCALQDVDPAAATAEFRAAVELDPAHLNARFNLANELARRGDAAAAAAEYREVLRRNPQHAAARYNLSLVQPP